MGQNLETGLGISFIPAGIVDSSLLVALKVIHVFVARLDH